MSLSRRLLYASETWEVTRPRTALTAGHLLIRLSNPAVAFDARSAADWLLCADAARQALAEVIGADRFAVVFAYQWHPIGTALGEPEAESSTPTFHLFGRWDGETATPGGQLRLPAHRRLPVATDDLAQYDDGLRAALRRSALERTAEAGWQAASTERGDTAAQCHLAEPAQPNAGPRHVVLATGTGSSRIMPADLMTAASALPAVMDTLGVGGLSCVAPDAGANTLKIHIVGRSVGEPVNPLELLLDLPEVSQALL